MKNVKLSDILGIINKMAPAVIAESWDNPGLQVGDPGVGIRRVMVALDASQQTIDAAISSDCQLLLTHHPLIFKPQKKLSNDTPLGRMIFSAIRSSLAVACMHTNYDSARNGLNDLLSVMLGVEDCCPLQLSASVELVKLVVFVPEGHLDKVRSSLFVFAENLGDYCDCSFSAGGNGTFTPLSGAHPFIGKVGTRETVMEYRLELLLRRDMLPRAIRAMKASHPYEEPAFDVYSLMNQPDGYGLGRVGRLDGALTLADFAAHVSSQLNATGVRYVGEPDRVISKVALCGGSGGSLIGDAVRFGADVLVTGDVRYHDARDAQAKGIALIDAGHFATEFVMVASVTERLKSLLVESGFEGCEVLCCSSESDPFIYS